MKNINFVIFISIFFIILTLINCTNTKQAINETNQQNDAERKGIQAPGVRHYFQSENNVNKVQEGLLINNVEWAAYNVDRDGVFVLNHEDSGWTYQWNSLRAEFSMKQSTAGLLPASFFTNYPIGNSWEKEKDPSPAGRRVPTLEEVRSLFDTSKVKNEWTTLNGVTGRRFTDISGGENIFIPAGGRWFSDIDAGERTLRKIDIGIGGYYWTATAQGDFSAETFEFNADGVSLKSNHRVLAFMIRPVKDK